METYVPKTFLEKVYFKYPDKNWNLRELLKNPCISFDVVKLIMNRIDDEKREKEIYLKQNIVQKSELEIETERLTDEIMKTLFHFDSDDDDVHDDEIYGPIDFRKRYYIFDHLNVFLNRNVPLEYIENVIKFNEPKSGDFEFISGNPNITEEFIEKYIECDWDWCFGLSYNKNISLAFIEKYIEKDWDWDGISSNPYLTVKFIEEHIDKKWDWDNELVKHPNIPLEFLLKHEDKFWNWTNISSHRNLTQHMIDVTYKDMPFYWRDISSNLNITIEFIEKHSDKEWNWDNISKNICITLDIIEKYADKPWSWYNGVSENPNLTLEFIERHIDKDWNWYEISSRQMLTNDFVRTHIHNFEFVKKNINDMRERTHSFLAYNPYLTMDFIDTFIDKINFHSLSMNRFENENNYYSERRTYTIQQTKKIEEELIQKAWHPNRFYDWCLCNDEK